MGFTVELDEPLKDNGACGQVHSERKRLGGKHSTDQAASKGFFNGLFDRRDQASMVAGNTGFE